MDGDMNPDRIPAIDIGPFLGGEPAARAAVAAAVRDACERIGFLILSGHGIGRALIDGAFRETRAFFDLPQADKDRWGPSGENRQRGYHGFATRRLAKTLGDETPPDLRESFFLGPIEDHRARFAGDRAAVLSYAPNELPDRPAAFTPTVLEIYRAFERLSADLLRLFAVALAMPEDHFADKIDRHFSILACHHYPVLEEAPVSGQLRTGAHTDFGAMTILAMTDATGGLEAQLPDGRWCPVQPGRHELVVNLGDMMARWTNDRFTSTLHRVAVPPLGQPASRRQSIGYFMHPNYDARIECLPTCRSAGARYPTITAGEHIRMKIERSHEAA